MRQLTMHPSTLTRSEWEWPFKTPEQREKVVQYQANPKAFDEAFKIDNLGIDNPF